LARKIGANLVAAIEKSKGNRCTGFSLDSAIRLVGEKASRLLAEHFLTLDSAP